MIITEQNNPVFPWKSNEERSQNTLHLSTIYTDLERELFGPPNDTGNRLWAEVGFLFEEALSLAFGDRLGFRPGEVELDGIVGSPDGIDFENWRVEEYKCTWKSTKTTPERVWRWMVQAKGYCKMMGMKECLHRVLYLNGNYKDDRSPQYKEFLSEFTQYEVDQNWEMLLKHARGKGWLK